MKSFKELNQTIIACDQCPRLRTHCASISRVKRASYKDQTYWGKPVPGFGDTGAHLWIVGLAPGAHGANRTGRVFTGDSSGEWLYSALFDHGLSSHPRSQSVSDELRLFDTYISCICRCAPPDNRPTQTEIKACSSFLMSEWQLLNHPPVILALGQIAFEQLLKLLLSHYQTSRETNWKFKHGATYTIKKTKLLVSYHPSQQNTATKRLTNEMWNTVFNQARQELKNHSL